MKMKQTSTFLSIIGLSALPLCASIDWDGDTTKTAAGEDTWIIANAAFTSTPPTIDGMISPGEWDAATANSLEFTTHSSMDPAGLAASFRVMWDETNLYVLVEGTDAAGIGGAGHRFELYISTAYTRKFGQWQMPGYGPKDYQILATIEPVDSFYSLGLYSAQAPLTSFERANVIGTDQYVSEVKIAWSDLGGLPSEQGLANSDYIGFEVQVQRGTQNNNRSKLAWAAPVDVAWASTEDWGTLRLLSGDGGMPETMWAGFSVDALGWVDTGDFLGVINVIFGDFVYMLSNGKFIYLPETHVTGHGAWGYIFR